MGRVEGESVVSCMPLLENSQAVCIQANVASCTSVKDRKLEVPELQSIFFTYYVTKVRQMLVAKQRF